MDKWQSTFLGLKQLPRELTGFEIEAFFTFTLAERQLIEERRRPTLKLGLALQIGFLRMSGGCSMRCASCRLPCGVIWEHSWRCGAGFGLVARDVSAAPTVDCAPAIGL